MLKIHENPLTIDSATPGFDTAHVISDIKTHGFSVNTYGFDVGRYSVIEQLVGAEVFYATSYFIVYHIVAHPSGCPLIVEHLKDAQFFFVFTFRNRETDDCLMLKRYLRCSESEGMVARVFFDFDESSVEYAIGV